MDMTMTCRVSHVLGKMCDATTSVACRVAYSVALQTTRQHFNSRDLRVWGKRITRYYSLILSRRVFLLGNATRDNEEF